MTATPASRPTARPAAATSPRAVIIDLLLNVAAPYGAYAVLKSHGNSEVAALVWSASVPAAVAIASLAIRRRINGLSLLVLAATAASLSATVLSGSAWFALIQPSFVTGLLALVFLASLALERPILFYLARDTTCPTAEEARAFEDNWQRPNFRTAMRRLTLVWAAFLGGEALLRVALAAIWPDETVIAASQLLWIVLPILLVRWSVKAGRRWGAKEA